MKSRTEYLQSNSLSRNKPWVDEGISRAKWYRKQRETQSRRKKWVGLSPTPKAATTRLVSSSLCRWAIRRCRMIVPGTTK